MFLLKILAQLLNAVIVANVLAELIIQRNAFVLFAMKTTMPWCAVMTEEHTLTSVNWRKRPARLKSVLALLRRKLVVWFYIYLSIAR